MPQTQATAARALPLERSRGAERHTPVLHPRRLKLLFYTHGLVDGGAERLWSCLATAMTKAGYDVVFVEDFPAIENRHSLADNIRLHTLGRNHVSAVRKLADILRTEKPDVALSAVAGSNLKLLLARRLAHSPVKVVASYHGFLEWQTGLLSFLTYLSLPFIGRSAEAVIVVSDGLRDKLVHTWNAPRERLVTIDNPVFFPEETLVPTAMELAKRPPVVLALGRMVVEKDFAMLIRAFAKVQNKDAKLVILGKGPLEQELRKEIERLNLQDRVTLAGYMPKPWDAYANARCFVLPSYSEAFGNVIIEAMAHGLPVVSTDCDGPMHILEGGKHGKVVAKRDEDAMAAAITKALLETGNPATRRARADVFSFSTRIPAYEAVIAHVLTTTGAAPTRTKDVANDLNAGDFTGHHDYATQAEGKAL
jgi:glycosyltransferase involved in cell wall biosynthesis